MVNRTFAATCFPDRPAIGEPIDIGGETDAEIVGLVEDSRIAGQAFEYCVCKFFGDGHRPRVEIDVAETGDDAWSRLHASRYDLAIIDFFLEHGTGAELIARVRQDTGLAGLPVLAISVGGNEAREKSLAAGADLFLDKPLVLRDLLYPGWVVTVDGRPVAADPEAEPFRAVSLDAGPHAIVWSYQPKSLWIGGIVSLSTLLVLLLAAVLSGRKKAVVTPPGR